MTAEDLIRVLSKVPPETRVVFDAEAARFNVHLVSVDNAYYEPETHDAVCLHSDAPRDH